jgi:osmotically inducible protein OsmC
MAFANGLSKAGFPPTEVHTLAKVHLEQKDGGFRIGRIELETDCIVPNIDENAFQQQAESAKQNCPVSKLLTGAEISLVAKLKR